MPDRPLVDYVDNIWLVLLQNRIFFGRFNVPSFRIITKLPVDESNALIILYYVVVIHHRQPWGASVGTSVLLFSLSS